MIGLVLSIAGLAGWGIIATADLVRRDGYRQQPVDVTRLGAR